MEWYYVRAGAQEGPLSQEQMRDLVRQGVIAPETLVWRSGMMNWQVYSVVTGLAVGKPIVIEGARATEPPCCECATPRPADEMIRFEESFVCPACKPVFLQQIREGMRLPGVLEFAGFWVRFSAKFLDILILTVLNLAVTGVWIGLSFRLANDAATGFLLVSQLLLFSIQFFIPGAYATWMVGRFGATVGKLAYGLRVVSGNGEKIGYARALGRFFAEYVSQMALYIGYLLALYDAQSRTLHDRICDTRVIRK